MLGLLCQGGRDGASQAEKGVGVGSDERPCVVTKHRVMVDLANVHPFTKNA